MTKIKAWWKATRPRTILLSISSVLMGGIVSAHVPSCSLPVVISAALTALLLQILSNFANDYGDFVKGLDNDQRTGPQRALQSGELTKKEMQVGIVLTAGASLVCGAALIFVFARLTWTELAVFAGLGLASVVAALLYTLGKHPYGYYGWGDFFIFLFFGWVAVCGTHYLATKTFDFCVLLPAAAMGFLACEGMNINNMRDYVNDKANGKNTIVVKMGLKGAFIYHVILLVMPFVCLSIFLWLKLAPWYTYAFWLLFPLFMVDLSIIHRTMETKIPNHLLPRQVFHTFLLTVVFGVLLMIPFFN